MDPQPAPQDRSLKELVEAALAGQPLPGSPPNPAAELAEPAAPQLPLWPELCRGVPNDVLRSALFAVSARGDRRSMKREPIASLDGIEIRYTGARLDQSDLDVEKDTEDEDADVD